SSSVRARVLAPDPVRHHATVSEGGKSTDAGSCDRSHGDHAGPSRRLDPLLRPRARDAAQRVGPHQPELNEEGGLTAALSLYLATKFVQGCTLMLPFCRSWNM